MITESEKSNKVALIARVFLNEYHNWQGVYEDIEEGYNFLSGDQYTESQKKYYNAKRRPVNVFNTIFPIFNQVLGDFYLNNQKIRVFPTQNGTAELAQMHEDILYHIQLESEGDMELGKALLAGLVKVGWLYPRYSNERQIDGSVIFSNVDEYEIMFDSRARNYFADDARYLLRSRWATVDDIVRAYPHLKTELLSILKDREDSAYFQAWDPSTAEMVSHPYFFDRGRYRVIEFHDKVYEETDVWHDQNTGESGVLTLDGKRRELFLRTNPQITVITRVERVKKITEVIPALAYFLDHRDADVQDQTFDYIPFFPYNFGKETIKNFGLMKNLIGPQKAFNDVENDQLDILNKQGNAGWYAKPSKILNYSDLRNFGYEPGLILEIENNTPFDDAIRRVEPPNLPAAHDRMSGKYIEFIKMISGATNNFMGMQEGSEDNASLFAQRVREAQKALVPSEQNFRRTKRRVFDKCIKLVQKYYTSERLFLIVNPFSGEQKELALNQSAGDRILNDVTVGEYRIAIDELERNPTARRVRFIEKTELVDRIAKMLGAAAIDYRWWLEESDLGDLKYMLQKIDAVLGQQIAAGQQAEAFEVAKNIIDTAKAKQGLDTAGLPAAGGPGKPRDQAFINK